MKIEIDSDAADSLGCAWLKELRENLIADIERASRDIEQEYQRQNVVNDSRYLSAVEAVLEYCGEL